MSIKGTYVYGSEDLCEYTLGYQHLCPYPYPQFSHTHTCEHGYDSNSYCIAPSFIPPPPTLPYPHDWPHQHNYILAHVCSHLHQELNGTINVKVIYAWVKWWQDKDHSAKVTLEQSPWSVTKWLPYQFLAHWWNQSDIMMAYTMITDSVITNDNDTLLVYCDYLWPHNMV